MTFSKKEAREKLKERTESDRKYALARHRRAMEMIKTNRALVARLISAGIEPPEYYDLEYSAIIVDCVTLDRVREVRQIVGASNGKPRKDLVRYTGDVRKHPDWSENDQRDWVCVSLDIEEGPFAGLVLTYYRPLSDDDSCRVEIQTIEATTQKQLICDV